MSDHAWTPEPWAAKPNPAGDTAACLPGHRRGSKPYTVPLAGQRGCFVVYHGGDYLDVDGNVVRQPVRFHAPGCTAARSAAVGRDVDGGHDAAAAAITRHEAALS